MTWIVLLLLLVMCPCDGKLVSLLSLSRHGSRAPNPVVSRLCPANRANLASYHVPLKQLTEKGMQQLVKAGAHVRRIYVNESNNFLASSFGGKDNHRFQTYFRADSEDRCGQSAISLGYGLYPDGTGPTGFPRQPIPVYMQLLPNEHDFAAPKGVCKRVRDVDLAKYAKTKAKVLFAKHKKLLTKIHQVCGVSVEDYPTIVGGEDKVLGVKDLADMFEFDSEEQLPLLKGVDNEMFAEIKALSFQMLMERYYSTPRMVTYWAGGFPQLVMNNLNQAANGTSKYQYYSYHGHRELLYAMSVLLGWQFNFEGQPRTMNTSSIPPATTMFFELHHENQSHFVRTFVWSPKSKRSPVKLATCSINCPLDKFNGIMKDHFAKTGTYNEICGYNANGVLPSNNEQNTVRPDSYSTKLKESAIFLISCGFIGVVYASFKNMNRHHYSSIN